MLDPSVFDRAHREHYRAIVATVIRVTGGDFAAAEEVVQDAFEAALRQWPVEGVPEQPRAWLIRAARNKAVDHVRRAVRFEERAEALAVVEEALALPPMGTEWESVPDDTLRLLFTCCHPALSDETQVALALRTLCGLTTEEVARAFLVPPHTMAQRLVRAQRKIKGAKIPYVIPQGEELVARRTAVAHAIYLLFSEGYAATHGHALLRVDLCTEAIRLGRLACTLVTDDPELMALYALMLLHHARRKARIAEDGGLILLDRQDRRLWDLATIEEGTAALQAALSRGGRGPFTIQAAIAALHAEASSAEATDWPQIAALYERLCQLAPSAVAELNRAAAVAMARGPEHGLALIDDLEASGRLTEYHLLPAARADLLRRLGRYAAAAAAYRRALALVRTEPERRFLQERLAEVDGSEPDTP